MSIILDIVFVAIVVLSTLIASKRGFIKVFFNLVGVVLALFIAMQFSVPSAQFVYDTFVEKSVHKSVVQTVEETAVSTTDSLYDAMPESVISITEKLNINLKPILDSQIEQGTSNISVRVADVVTEKVVEPFAVKLASIILFMLLFIISLILIKVIVKALNLVSKLPILKSANKTLGAVVGVLQGVCICVILCFVLTVITSIMAEGLFGIKKEVLDASFVYKIFNVINPLK